MKATRLVSAMLTGASLFSLGTIANAQEGPPTEGTEVPGEIVVTGSRVIKDGNSSPSPVTVVQTNDLLATQPGANLADALNSLPVFAGSRGAGSNPTTAGSASGGNGSANQLNLRNLGIVRTLVLVDGVRIPPTLFNGAVDVDLIPQMLVQRVDIVTGGVSAVYGSDAVAGVVNYVLDKKFKGLKVEASGGISEYGDASQLDAGVAYGTRIGSRGHFEASYQYHDGNGILRRSDRPWMNNVGVGGLGTSAAPYQLFSGLTQANFPTGGRIINCGTGCAATGQYFASSAGLSPFVNGAATGTNGLQVGGAGGTWDSSLLQPLVSHQLFGRLSYEFTDSISGYIQASGNFKENENYQEYARYTNVRLLTSNPFLPASARTALGSATNFTFSKTLENAPRVSQLAKSDQIMVNAGLAGKLGDNWDWAVDYVFGRSVLDTQLRNNINNQRLAAALDAVASGGQTVCYAATQAATAAAYSSCVPLNPFGPGSESAAALDYVMGTTNYRAMTLTNDISGSISGTPLNLPAGPLNVALSGEWRKISFEATSDATSQDLVNCAGLRSNCTATQTQWFVTLPTQPKVSQTVWEVAGEFDAPIFSEGFIGQSFNINGAARFTKYNTSGKYWTWKVGLDWKLTDTLRIRGTRSRDIRAPTLSDLFGERFVVQVVGTDLLTNTSPTIPSLNGGNPNLKAEIGNTLTAGVVWRPTPKFSVAIDGYRIKVTDAILSVNGGEQAFQRACYTSNGTSPYCDLQTRPNNFSDTSAANAWTSVTNGLFNISSIKTWGVDAEASFTSEVFSRPFSIRVLGTYQPELLFSQPNVPSREQAGSAFGPVGFAATPKWRLIGLMRFKPADAVTIDIQQRWRSGMKLSGEEGATQVWVNNKMKSFATTGINVSFEAGAEPGKMQFFINVQNLFDAAPPIGAFYGNGTRAGLRDGYAVGDDPRGRYYTAGVRIKM